MNINNFYKFSENLTQREATLRDSFWGPKIPKHNFPSPNILTIIRIIGTIVLFIYPPQKYLFILIVIILFLTDYFDGIIARTQKKETTFGKYADPIADKMLLINIVYFLYLNNHIWLENFFKMLIPEVCILILAGILLLQGKSIIPKPNVWGRLKFTLYAFAIIIFLFDKQFLSTILLNLGIISAYIAIIGYSERIFRSN